MNSNHPANDIILTPHAIIPNLKHLKKCIEYLSEYNHESTFNGDALIYRRHQALSQPFLEYKRSELKEKEDILNAKETQFNEQENVLNKKEEDLIRRERVLLSQRGKYEQDQLILETDQKALQQQEVQQQQQFALILQQVQKNNQYAAELKQREMEYLEREKFLLQKEHALYRREKDVVGKEHQVQLLLRTAKASHTASVEAAKASK